MHTTAVYQIRTAELDVPRASMFFESSPQCWCMCAVCPAFPAKAHAQRKNPATTAGKAQDMVKR